jgi:hypothetical protein
MIRIILIIFASALFMAINKFYKMWKFESVRFDRYVSFAVLIVLYLLLAIIISFISISLESDELDLSILAILIVFPIIIIKRWKNPLRSPAVNYIHNAVLIIVLSLILIIFILAYLLHFFPRIG